MIGKHSVYRDSKVDIFVQGSYVARTCKGYICTKSELEGLHTCAIGFVQLHCKCFLVLTSHNSFHNRVAQGRSN